MSSPFQIFCNMYTKKFCIWFISYICISISNFWFHWKFTLLCMVWHCYCFPMFVVRLFFWNQYSSFFITSFTSYCRTFASLSMINKLISSANKTNRPSSTFKGRSFIYIKNKRGPRTEPCGTPHFSTLHEEIYLEFIWLLWFISTNCFRSVK